MKSKAGKMLKKGENVTKLMCKLCFVDCRCECLNVSHTN